MIENRLAIYHRVHRYELEPGEGVIETSELRVNAAVAVIVTSDESVLFGRRRLPGNDFEWQLPGGWIEVGETAQQAARREVQEETALTLSDLRYVGFTDNVFSPHKHSLSLYFEAECVDRGALVTTENEKCQGWEWKCWDDITDQLFLPLRLLRQSGYRPFSAKDQRTRVSN